MKFTSTLFALALFLIWVLPANSESYSTLSPEYVQVDPALPFKDKVMKHITIFRTLAQSEDDVKQTRAEADSEKSYDKLKQAEVMDQTLREFLIPYASASIKAEALGAEGQKIKSYEDPSGQVCNAQGECSEIDPIVAAIMTILGLISDEINKDQPFGQNNDLVKFLQRPAGGPNSAFSIARETVIGGIPENNELGKALRDPVKWQIESVKNTLNKLDQLAKHPEETVKDEAKRLEGEARKELKKLDPSTWKF